MKAWLLFVHRWVALIFALPLIFVIGTGLILSVEPWLVIGSIAPNSLTPAAVGEMMSKHDPAGQARAISYRSYDNTLTIGAGRGGGKVVDVATGELHAGPSALARTLVTMRQMHETLLLDLGWLVTASTGAMLGLALFGVLMGWPRFANSIAGWHKAVGWGLLPLVVLSPLTGLMLATGVTLSSPPARPAADRGAPLKLAEAVNIVGREHDLSSLVWLRPLGGQLAARIVKDGEYAVYTVTREGTKRTPRNWPRLWHEGTFGLWVSWLNLLTSIALAGLLGTGVWLWLRRQFRRRTRRPRREGAVLHTP